MDLDLQTLADRPALTDHRRWEVVYEKMLLDKGISYDNICRVWPIFIRTPIEVIERYLRYFDDLNFTVNNFISGAIIQ